MNIEIAIGKVVYTFVVWYVFLTTKVNMLSIWDQIMLRDKFYLLLSYGWMEEHEPRCVSAIGLNDMNYFTFEWFRNYIRHEYRVLQTRIKRSTS